MSKSDLPYGWILCKSEKKNGKSYYFNKKTGQSSWEFPVNGVPVGRPKRKSDGNNNQKKSPTNKKKVSTTLIIFFRLST